MSNLAFRADFGQQGKQPPAGWLARLRQALSFPRLVDEPSATSRSGSARTVAARSRPRRNMHRAEADVTGDDRFNLMFRPALEDMDVIVCGDLPPQLRGSLNELATIARGRTYASGLPAVCKQLDLRQGARTLLVLKVSEPSSDLEMLLSLRQRFPETVVVIVSPEFTRNDFSCERLAICDASLRLEAGSVAFAVAISAAIANHRVHLARMGRSKSGRRSLGPR